MTTAKINVLESRMSMALEILARIEQKVDQIESRLRTSEVSYACLATELDNVKHSHKNMQTRLEKADFLAAQWANKSSFEELEERVRRIEPPIKIMLWFGGLIGAAAVALIWAVITQQAVLTFP